MSKRFALAVDAIKRSLSPKIPAAPRIASDFLEKPTSYALSRRQAIRVAGASALLAAPATRALGSVISNTASMRRIKNGIAFSVAGIDRWIIDTSWFEGSPSLSISDPNEHQEITIELKGALYPGTRIPADFTAKLDERLTSLHLSLFAFGAADKIDFVPWLLETARWEAPSKRMASIDAVSTTSVVARGSNVRFRPTWTLHIDGDRHAIVDTLEIDTSTLAVHLNIGKQSLLASRKGSVKPTTLLAFTRGEHVWPNPASLNPELAIALTSNGSAFDTLTWECTADGRSAGLLEGDRENALRLVSTYAETSMELPLRNQRYGWSREEDGLHEAFVARYSKNPVWIRANGASLEVADSEELAPLEITSVNGEVKRFTLAPALLRYALHMQDAITQPTDMPRGTRVALTVSNISAKAFPKAAFHMAALQIDTKNLKVGTIDNNITAGQLFNKEQKPVYRVDKNLGRLGKIGFVLPTNPRVTVIRPEDLLVLTFEFVNCNLNRSGGTFTPSGSGAKLIVHFQPQHIAERAFFYVDDTIDPGPIPPSGKTNNGNEPRLDPPIDAVLSHPSRLSFRLPNGYAGKFKIDGEGGLLDWSKLEQFVSPSAKPPKAEFVLNVFAKGFATKYVMAKEKDTKPNSKWTTAYKADNGGGAGGGGGGNTMVGGGGNISSLANVKTMTMKSNVASSISVKGAAAKEMYEYSPDFSAGLSAGILDELYAVEQLRPPIKEPTSEETAIEYPYRLILSPNKYAAWAHQKMPIFNLANRRAELWHTRLGVKHASGVANEEAAYFRTMRAIWSPDVDTDRTMPAAYKERPFRTSVNRRDRHEIVQLTSNYGMKDTKEAPIDVKRFMLSSLGAWADMVGAWDPMATDFLDVEQWVQQGTQGRDHFVRVCYKGFLFPFRNRATLVKETERKFRRTPRGDMAAYLMQRLYIIVRQPTVEYPADGIKGMQYQGRDIPFRKITITTKVTPNLLQPEMLKNGVGLSSNSFWPRFQPPTGAADVMWTCIGTDWDNNEVDFSTPLVFLANTDACNVPGLASWINDYKSGDTYDTGAAKRRTIAMGGQHIAFAPSVKKGDTAMPTEKFLLSAYYTDTVDANTPRFFPSMRKSKVKIEKVAELVGTNAGTDIEFYKKYLEWAFEKGPNVAKGAVPNANDLKNTAQIFVKLINNIGLDFSAATDKAGGLAAPSLNISGLSRLMGPISGDLANVANAAIAAGNFDPMQYFEDILKAKILGDITLQDVIKFVMDVLSNMDQMPGLDKKDDFGIKGDMSDITNKAEELKTEAQKLANDVASEVKDARDALVAEVNKVKNEIQGYINEGKKAVEDRINEWKKRIEDKATELKSEVEKALKPLIDAGNEAYKKYEAVSSALEDLKKGLSLTYEWQTEIKSTPGNILVPLHPGTTDKDKKAILYLKASFTKKLDLNPPEILIYGSLSNFIINLIGDGAAQFLIIKFARLAVSMKIGQKPDIDPNITAVEFAGPLTFVNKLKDLIPRGGSAGGVGFSFDLNVAPAGIEATLTITLPNVTVGVFSLQNMSFLMRLTIPFDGRSFSAYFAFCTRENPFRITVMVFGGGGFFGIEITPAGVRMLEAAFEFGGNFAFDCGIASGGASVMAGVYYKLEIKEIDGKDVEQTTLTAYFKLSGNLSVLGIIRVSLTFELKLTWQDNGKLWGTATIEVEIEILFLSFSVGVTVERQLKGSDSDPTFYDMLPQPSMWEEYCNAFA